MSEECTHDCNSCSSDCADSTKIQAAALHPQAEVKRVYAVCGSKGGVGRTTMAALLASTAQKQGLQSALLDADLTSPALPGFFGLQGRVATDAMGIFPMETEAGTQVISVNLIIPNPTDPILAKGNLAENTLKKFWSEVIWEEVDLMLIDMPAGTGEITLSALTHMAIDGLIVVTEPGRTAALMTEKTLKMAKALKLPVAGMIVNRAIGMTEDLSLALSCSYARELAEKYQIPVTIPFPYDPQLAAFCDEGETELYNNTDRLIPLLERMQ